ncbi:MAG TPA: TetR family transcriptional regulator [Acidimicrobiales bacterium]|nr:TetR family transcriptional regulator [Acidimicrobiales bacterium]
MAMSTDSHESARGAQKRRTRAALVAAARELVASGASPTIDGAAARAGVSRATAYRYFSTPRELLIAAHPEVGASSLLPEDAPDDVAARLDIVIEAFIRSTVENEAQQRTMLRLSLEHPAERAQLPLRQGRAIQWITEALEGDPTLPEAVRQRLALAIRSATGIEALVWLTDIAGLSRQGAAELMRWSAQAMLRQALVEQAAGPGEGRSGASASVPAGPG